MQRRGKRKETLPPYELHSNNNNVLVGRTEVPSPVPALGQHTRGMDSPHEGTHRSNPVVSLAMDWVYAPVRSFSGGSLRRMSGMLASASAYSPFSPGSMLGEEIFEAPEPMQSPTAPPPPSYSASIKPMLLWLDGGGNKVVLESHVLEDLMHKLAWDLKFTSPQPGRMIGGEYVVPPYDCFDWVGSCGCGTIIAFLIACGLRTKHLRAEFISMTQALRDGNEAGLHLHLEKLIPGPYQCMEFDGIQVKDSPAMVSVWVPAEADVANNPGICVLKGEPLKARLLPLVMQEVRKELDGKAEFLDCTVQFLQDVCPVFEDCSFLLSIGSGEVPRPKPNVQQSWWDWAWGQNMPSPHPPLPPCLPQRRNNIIPPKAYMDPPKYVRLSPELSTRTERGIERPDDWTTDVTEILSVTSSYLGKEEVRQQVDHINDLLKRKDIQGPEKRGMIPSEPNHASGSRPQRRA